MDRIHDADLETRIIGINTETGDMVVDKVFNYTISSMKYHLHLRPMCIATAALYRLDCTQRFVNCGITNHIIV